VEETIGRAHASIHRTFSVRVGIALFAAIALAGAACVDTGKNQRLPLVNSDASADAMAIIAPDASLDALPGPDPCTDPPQAGRATTLAYTWKNVTIIGGGFVTGIEFSVAPGGKDVLYARTDVGGAYRSDSTAGRWIPITDWVGRDNSNLMGIESIAPDPADPNVVYMAAGEYLTAGNGVILRSTDQGSTWTQNPISVPMGGNVDGRNMGERLAVDPNLTSTLYFGSRNTGLWQSTDSASTWRRVASFPAAGDMNYGLSFVFFDKRAVLPSGATSTFYVGIATTAANANTLFRTTDGGMTWQPIAAPSPAAFPRTGSRVLFPHHAAMDSLGMLYLPYNNLYGPNGITGGAVFRFDTSSDTWMEITPSPGARGGYGGVSVDPMHPGTMVVSTLDRWPDEIYRTTDSGTTWTTLGPLAVRDVAGANWLYWHGGSPNATGWMGDIEIDPHNPARVLYNTGQGLWWCDDVTPADRHAPTNWTFKDEGLEETVANGLISPSRGAHLVTALGDIAGFRHDDLDVSPPNGMFDSPIFGNTTGIDFAEKHPSLIVRVGTTGSNNTTQHGAYSVDGGQTWTAFPAEPASAGAGSIGVSADGATIVWSPQSTRQVTATPAYSRDRGSSWIACSGLPNGARVAADRMNPDKFYAMVGSAIYRSIDGGGTFATTGATVPGGAGAPRPVWGLEGDLWVAASGGLFHSIDSGATFAPATDVQSATAVGFGLGATCDAYPVLYLAGRAKGVSGVYRSDDKGISWQRIDDPQHQYGFVNYVAGDPRRYGRAYLGTGGRGILYGDPPSQ
jgi:hypothetical protein